LRPIKKGEIIIAAAKVRPLVEILAEINDVRQKKGLRHPLAGMLALACVAMLCGYRRVNAIAEWGRNYGERYASELGFEKHGYPAPATWYRVFGEIDLKQLELKLMEWCEMVLYALQGETGLLGVSIDGKTLRGSQRQGAENSHLLSAYVHELGLVLSQVGVADKTNELGVVEEFLLGLVLRGRVITGDALFTQQFVTQLIVDNGGEYVFPVKENQALTYQALEFWFDAPAPPETPNQVAQVVEKAHGRLTTWQIETTTALNEYLDWPALAQAFKITRSVRFPKTGETQFTVRYGITSLAPEQADASQLLTFSRQHWGIENGLHWVREVTFDEDRSILRVGHTHHLMATLRNLTLSLLHATGHTQIASSLRFFAAQPDLALALVTGPLLLGE
jgi:predicted transposase YbfD/YdcC